MHKKSWKHKTAWCLQGGVERTAKAGEQEVSDDDGKKLALHVAALYLEGCLSKEIWKLCERQTRNLEETESIALTQFSACLRLSNLIENITLSVFQGI